MGEDVAVNDPRPLTPNRMDRYEPESIDDDSASTVRAEIVGAPRRVRSELVKLDGQILAHQDVVEALYPLIRSQEARRLLNRLHGGLEETHQLSRRITDSIERGG